MVALKHNLKNNEILNRTETNAPIFTLVGQDAAAPLAITFWAMARKFIRSDDMASVGQAMAYADEFRTYHADFLKRHPEKRRDYPLDVVVWLHVQQQLLENLIGLNEQQPAGLKFSEGTLENAKRILHRLYAEAVAMDQRRGR
jgi:hypothetical protein